MSYQKKLALFHSFDKNGNGFLNKKEFCAFSDAAGLQLNSLEIDLIFQKFDIDSSGDISIEEFEVFLQDEMKRLSPEFYKERVINPKAHLSFDKSQYGSASGGKNKNKDKATSSIETSNNSLTSADNNSNNISNKNNSNNSKAATATAKAVQARTVAGVQVHSPRLSKTDPVRSRPVSAVSRGSSASASASASAHGAKALSGSDNKLIGSLRGIGGIGSANNPLTTKSLDIPSKLAFSFSQGASVERIIGHDNGSSGSCTGGIITNQQESSSSVSAAGLGLGLGFASSALRYVAFFFEITNAFF